MHRHKNRSTTFLKTTFFLLAAAGTLGCQTVMKTAHDAELPAGSPQYIVRMIGEGWSKSEQFRGAISGPMTIDDVLTESKAKQRFRNMEIQILRQMPETGAVVRMPVDYDATADAVPSEQNYAVHSNDRITIRQKSSDPLTKVVESIVPSFAR